MRQQLHCRQQGVPNRAGERDSGGGEPTTAPNVEAVAAGALGLGNFSALADRSNPRLPWVVSRAGGTYYRNGCGGGARIPPKERLYFRTEGEVQRCEFSKFWH